MIWLKLWNMLHIKRVQNIVQTVPSIYSLPLIFVLVVVKGFALNPRKENHDPLQ